MIIYSAVQLLEKMINLFYRTHDVDEQEKIGSEKINDS